MDNTLSIHADCPPKLVDVIQRVKYAQLLFNSDLKPPILIDIKHVVCEGRILDIMTQSSDFQVLKQYLHTFPSDKPQLAQRKIELILTCIDQASSLDGQWKATVLNGLNELLDDCLSDPISFFNPEDAPETGVLQLLNDLYKNYQHEKLKAAATSLEQKIKHRQERNLDNRWQVTKAVHEVHPLTKMTTGTAIMLGGMVILSNGISSLSSSSSQQGCCCNFNNSLANASACDLQSMKNSAQTNMGIANIVLGIAIGIFPTIKTVINLPKEERS